MTSSAGDLPERERRLGEVVFACLQSLEAGRPLDRDELLARHPEFAAELAAFFADQDRLRHLAPPAQPAARDDPQATVAWVRRGLPLLPGAVGSFGDYELLAEVGHGGMGVVYQARQTKLNRVVALKMILAGSHAGAEELSRFRSEAEAVARVQHPHVVQIYEVGEHLGEHFISLEFCAGGSLATKLRDHPLPPGEAAALLEKLARGVEAVHQKGVVHRDLKPGNVLLAEDGTPKITDFGLAKKLDEAGQTVSGAVLGTPSYMAPEQADGRTGDVGPRADVYSLGAILYECLVGRPPFRAATTLETLLQVRLDEPVAVRRLQPQVPVDLQTVCHKCLQKDPARRYATAQELADDLRRFQEGRPVVARPVGRWARAAKWTRRNPALAGALTAVAVTLVLGTAISVYFGVDATHQAAGLAQANITLGEKATALETALAQALLAPLATQGGDQPMSAPEWQSLWRLATYRPGRLGYRFVEEAAGGPVTSRQLRDRAALALPAAVGLDLKLRDEVEALLLTRLDDPAVGDAQKTDLARAAMAWDGLSSRAASRAARRLAQAIMDPKERDARGLAQKLADVAARLEPGDASQTAAALIQAMQGTRDPLALRALAEGLPAVAARLEPGEASRTAAGAAAVLTQAIKEDPESPSVSSLARGLSAVAARLEPGEASRAAATLGQTFKHTIHPIDSINLAKSLSAVAARLEPGEAAAHLSQALRDAREPSGVLMLEPSLAAAAARLEPREAVTALIRAVRDSKPLQNRIRGTASAVDKCLLAMAARLSPEEAPQMAATLIQELKDATEAATALEVMRGLSTVSSRLEPREAARAAAALVQAMKDAREPNAFFELVQSLSVVSPRLEPGERARVAAFLLSMMTRVTDPKSQQALAQSFAAALADLTPAAHRLRGVGLAAAVCSGAGGPFLPPAFLHGAAEPLPCSLSTQQLVELLKLPTCFGEARLVVLDHLGNRYQRRFPDVWAFVRFAGEQRLDLDFTSPPSRPD